GDGLEDRVRALAPDGVDQWRVGDEVIVPRIETTSYTSDAVVPAASVVAKPAGLSFELAGSVALVGGTAAHAVEAAKVAGGETLLVHGGAGGVGGLVVQLAVRRGARVIATASEANHDYLRGLGAEPVVYGDGLEDRVRALAPDGVDASIDTIGSNEAVDVSLALVPDTARIVSIAAFHRGDDGITLIGGGPGADPGTELRAKSWPEIAQLVADGELDLPIARTYPLEETAQAHRDSVAGHTRGKLVVVP
ncbi:MAG: zinc-binding dehydrogenase, partial [Actinomycetota bacterium]|nr:zinc-binding dehydrogenase [Actinomycetota bacterium]